VPNTPAKKRELRFVTGDAAREPKWTEKAWTFYKDDKLRLSLRGSEARLSGECPRCGHPLSDGHPLALTMDRLESTGGGRPVGGGSSVGALGGGGGAFDETLAPIEYEDVDVADEELELVFTCACTLTHRDRPEGKSGCGVYFSLFVTLS
jgi:hypothetical protein